MREEIAHDFHFLGQTNSGFEVRRKSVKNVDANVNEWWHSVTLHIIKS